MKCRKACLHQELYRSLPNHRCRGLLDAKRHAPSRTPKVIVLCICGVLVPADSVSAYAALHVMRRSSARNAAETASTWSSWAAFGNAHNSLMNASFHACPYRKLKAADDRLRIG